MAGLYFLSALLNLVLSPGSGRLTGPAQTLLSRHLLTAGLLGIGCLLVALLAWLRSRRAKPAAGMAAILVMALALVDLILWASPIRTEAQERIDRPSRIAAVVNQDGGHWVKLLRDANLDRFPGRHAPATGRDSLRFNWGMLERVRYAFGYEPTVPARFDALMGRTAFSEFDVWGRLMGVTHVATTMQPASTQVRELLQAGKLRVIRAFEEENLVLLEAVRKGSYFEAFGGSLPVEGPQQALGNVRRLGADRRVAVVEKDPVLVGGRKTPGREHLKLLEELPGPEQEPQPDTIRLTESGPGRRVLSLDLREPVFLVLRDTFSPGWTARVDGREVPIFRSDYLYLGVVVGPPARSLVLEYDPRGFATGGVISLITGLVVLSLFGVALVRRRRTSSDIS